MEVASVNSVFNAGEHNFRVLKVNIEDTFSEKQVRLAFITPKGRRLLSAPLTFTDGEASYALPGVLLDGRGKLLVQVTVYDGDEFIAKSRVKSFNVEASIDSDEEFFAATDMITPGALADRVTELENITSHLDSFALKSDIPESVSELKNDAGYLTAHQSLENYAAKEYVDRKMSSVKNITSLNGKVWNALGDSQTEENSHKTKIYYEWVEDALGISAVNNYGISGSTVAKKSASDADAMCVRYASMEDNADIITVMGGVNDMLFNIPIGTPDSVDDTTFYGAMKKLCDGLLSKYPGKTVVFITPTEQNNTSCTEANTAGLTATDFANAMKEVCASFSIPCYDANSMSGICPKNSVNAQLYTTDSLHLNNKGHEVLATGLYHYILGLPTVKNSLIGDVFPSVVPVSSVSLDESTLTLTENCCAVLNASVLPLDADNRAVTWYADSANVSLLPQGRSCTVLGVSEGSAEVICTSAGTEYSASCSVTVKASPVEVTSVSLSKNALSLSVGGSETLYASVLPENASDKTVVWSASNSNCTVEDGTVTAVSEGECVITAASSNGKTASCDVTVQEVNVSSLELSASELTVAKNSSAVLTALVLPENAGNKSVIWMSDSSNVMVSFEEGEASCTVFGVSVGKGTVTCITEDGGFEAVCTVTVSDSEAEG